MEWTKETLIGTCIRCKNETHGKRIVEFYKSFGFKSFGYIGTCVGMYYGIENDTTLFLCFKQKKYFTKEISLPTKQYRKFPREMIVSMTGKEDDWIKKMVYGKIKSKNYSYITKDSSTPSYVFMAWKYAKEID